MRIVLADSSKKEEKKTANFGHLSSGDDLQAQTRFQCAHKYHWPTSFIKCSCEAKPMRPNRKTDPHSHTHQKTNPNSIVSFT